jgi:hypothetical protein
MHRSSAATNWLDARSTPARIEPPKRSDTTSADVAIEHRITAVRDLIGRRIDDARRCVTDGDCAGARERVAELHEPMTRAVRDARSELLRSSLPKDVPVSADLDVDVRHARVLGVDASDQIAKATERAAAALTASASLVGPDGGVDTVFLDAWAARHCKALRGLCETSIRDSQQAILHAVGKALRDSQLAERQSLTGS